MPAFSFASMVDWLKKVTWGEDLPDEERIRPMPGLPGPEHMPVAINHSRVKGGASKLDSGGFYVTVQFPCGVCGEEFLLTPAAQKYILEERGVPRQHLESAAFCSKCLPLCRERNDLRRRLGAIGLERSAILRSLQQSPESPALLVGSARTRVILSAAHASGDLDGAIADARRAREIDPHCREALYWEARAHELAGRFGEARELFAAFCSQLPADQSIRALQSDAGARLAAPLATVLPDPSAPSADRLAVVEQEIEARSRARAPRSSRPPA